MDTDKYIAFMQTLRPGDIILASCDTDWISRIIRFVLGGKKSHVILYCGSGYIIESICTGVRKVVFKDTVYPQKYRMTVVRSKRLDSGKASLLVEDAEKYIGRGYDFLMMPLTALFVVLTRLGFRCRTMKNWFDMSKYEICSELVLDLYDEHNITVVDETQINATQVVPDDFINNGVDLEIISEYVP